LRSGNLPLEERVKLMQKQLEIQNAMSTQQRRGLEAQSVAGLDRLRGTLQRGQVTTVGGQLPTGVAGSAAVAKQNAAFVAAEREQRMKTLTAEFQARERMQEELAVNFRMNMQRAFGSVLTEFVTTGKVSLREMFASIKQIGGSMIGEGVSKSLSGLFGALKMTPFGSLLAGAGLLGLGSLFGRKRSPQVSAQDQLAQDQSRFAANEDARRRQEQEMRDFVAGRTAGRGGVVQSAGQVLQETSASRMIGELVAIRVAVTRTADALANGLGGANVGSAQMASAVDRLLGTRVQTLRLSGGAAVTV
jgi:hypothetical protein